MEATLTPSCMAAPASLSFLESEAALQTIPKAVNVPVWALTDTWASLPSMPQAMDPRFCWERSAEPNEVRSQGSTSSSLSSSIRNAGARSTISLGTCGIKLRKGLYLSWSGCLGISGFFWMLPSSSDGLLGSSWTLCGKAQ